MAIDAAIDSLAEHARQREQLAIEANLSVTIESEEFAVSSAGDRVVVHAPSVTACLGVFQRQRGRLPELAEMLDTAGVTVEVRTGNSVLAIVGAAASPGRLTRRLFSEAVQIRINGVLSGLFRFR
ncbi:hypothetical protein [Halovenus sp. HT40]|uniref:hypothetical protein n=1 Tax=Halovenus sp. HT40 TaxID=3126691 RepID=UPI00300E9B9E